MCHHKPMLIVLSYYIGIEQHYTYIHTFTHLKLQTVAKSWQPNKNKGFKYLDPLEMYLKSKMRSMIHISLCVFPSFLGLSLSHHLMIHSSAEWGEDLTQKYKGLKFRNKNTQPWDLSHKMQLYHHHCSKSQFEDILVKELPK